MANFSIKDLSDFSGLKQHTIRVWEQRYSFLQPQRLLSAHRTYTAEELHVLLDAALLNQNGYKVSFINKMSLEKKMSVFSAMADQQQRKVHELIISMAKMDAAGFERSLDCAVESWGYHATIQQVLLPFCEKTGIWQNGYSRNYQENIIIVRHCIRHMLITGIKQACPAMQLNKTVLLFMAAGQVQDLTLLYLQYLCGRNGFTTQNLGPQVSAEHLELICSKFNPQYIICHLGKGINGTKDIGSFVTRLQRDGKARFISLENSLPAGSTHPLYSFVSTPAEAMELLLQHEFSTQGLA